MVSLIIVNYNAAQLIVDAINSVFIKTDSVDFEIIVIDNNSNDDSQRILDEHFGQKVQYFKLPENIGFGCANNVGIEMASPDSKYIFLLNPDTLLVNNAVKILSNYMDANPNVGVAGGNLYDRDMKPIYSYHRPMPGIWTDEMRYWTLGINKLFIRQPFHNHSGYPLKVGNISGADMMIRREVLDKSGVFDPDFFMYSEETELTYRIRKLGYLIVNVPEAKIIHLEGQCFSFNADRTRRMLEGRAKYYQKTRGNLYLILANMLLCGGLRFRILIHTFINRSDRQYFMDYLAIVKQTYGF